MNDLRCKDAKKKHDDFVKDTIGRAQTLEGWAGTLKSVIVKTVPRDDGKEERFVVALIETDTVRVALHNAPERGLAPLTDASFRPLRERDCVEFSGVLRHHEPGAAEQVVGGPVRQGFESWELFARAVSEQGEVPVVQPPSLVVAGTAIAKLPSPDVGEQLKAIDDARKSIQRIGNVAPQVFRLHAEVLRRTETKTGRWWHMKATSGDRAGLFAKACHELDPKWVPSAAPIDVKHHNVFEPAPAEAGPLNLPEPIRGDDVDGLARIADTAGLETLVFGFGAMCRPIGHEQLFGPGMFCGAELLQAVDRDLGAMDGWLREPRRGCAEAAEVRRRLPSLAALAGELVSLHDKLQRKRGAYEEILQSLEAN